MIFSEIYSTYYNAVARIIKTAVDHPLNADELNEIVASTAFGESILNIAPSLTDEKWQLLYSDGSTPIEHEPTMPLTTLQKRWLKAISLDPRVRLFADAFPELVDVEPLFTPEDIYVFDKYTDGDPYADEKYIGNFRLILDAIKNRYPLAVNMITGLGDTQRAIVLPKYLEYSEKDDKFRLVSEGYQYGRMINLARITKCTPYTKPYLPKTRKNADETRCTVEFELKDYRNALERVLLHFAHFQKEAERTDEFTYKIKIYYDKSDETEMVIRILSFGPMIKVLSPQNFVNLIKERLKKQKNI